eukprot:jgi/Mesen1/10638/ME000894S10212
MQPLSAASWRFHAAPPLSPPPLQRERLKDSSSFLLLLQPLQSHRALTRFESLKTLHESPSTPCLTPLRPNPTLKARHSLQPDEAHSLPPGEALGPPPGEALLAVTLSAPIGGLHQLHRCRSKRTRGHPAAAPGVILRAPDGGASCSREGRRGGLACCHAPAAHARGRARVAPPDAAPPSDAQMSQLHDFIANSKRLVVLTGAGISTESGIPDYRGPQGAYSTGFKPMPHQEFVRSEASQQRYWARSYIGWRRFTSATPGPSHKALARLEARGRVGGGMITQNVDSNPVELHGTTHRVVCLGCGHLSARHALQARIQLLNPEWAANVEYLSAGAPGSEASFGMRLRPDGDVEIGEEFWRDYRFVVPPCELCGGPLKPDVVFFGDNVPKERADEAHAMVANGDAMLAVGSSLMVLSAFRLARQMIDGGKPLALLNVGPTRADELASVKVEARCGEVLTRLISFGSLDVPVV